MSFMPPSPEQQPPDLFSRPASDDDADEGGDEARAEYNKELLSRLATMIRSISGRPDLEVTTDVDPATMMDMAAQGKDARREWFRQTRHDPLTRQVTAERVHIPDTIAESSEEVAQGKAAHEAGHVAITRYGEFVPEKVIRELGFSSTIAAAEERATDQVVRERFQGAGKWIDRARRDNIHQALQAARERTGSIPKFMQLCDLLVHHPHLDEIPPMYDPEIVQLYESVRKDIERLERTIPDEGDPEKKIQKRAQDRYRIVLRKIWPEVQKLLQQDLQNEKLRQMVEESEKQQQGQQGEGEPAQQEAKPNPLDELPEDLKKELEKALQQLEREAGLPQEDERGKKQAGETGEEKPPHPEIQEGGREPEKSESKKPPEQTPEGMPESGEQAKKTTEGAPREQKDAGERKGGKGGKPETAGTPLNMSRISEGLRKALEKIFQQLPPDIRKELEERAQEMLENLEDAVVKEMAGKLERTPVETHEERRDREEKETRDVLTEEARKKAEATEEMVETVRAGMTEYEKVYQEIREYDEELYRRLEQIFLPNVKRNIRLRATGPRINLPAVFRWETDKAMGKIPDHKIFERVELPKKRDYAFTILVDLSGSMRGEKVHQTFRGVILLAEVLNRLGIQNEVIGFQDVTMRFKRFEEDLTDEIREKISGMVDEVYNRNPGGRNQSSYNDDGPCLLEASQGIEALPAKDKFLIVLSDGSPEGRRSDADDLTRAVQHILQETKLNLIGVGLGQGTGHVQKYYPTSLPNISVDKLTETLGTLLEEIINHPEKFRQKTSA
jgi:hypothetical protein